MKKLIFSVIIFLSAFSFAMAENVNVIMNDGSVFKGTMMGKTSDELIIKDSDGRTSYLTISNIKSVFDSDNGSAVDLTVISSASNIFIADQAVSSSETDETYRTRRQ